MTHRGDYDAGNVVYGKFTTFRPSTGAAYTLAGTPALSVYKDNSTTQSTAGVTLTADFDSVTGLNHFAIDTSADGTFYAAGSNFDIVITTGTVDGVSVVGAVVASFTIRKNSSLKPTTAGRTLDVSSGGEAGVDWANVGSPTTTLNLSGTTVKTATDVETDTADIQTRLPAALVSGRMASDVIAISGDTAAADNLEAYTDGTTPMPVNTTQFAGTNITAASGIPEVRVASIANNAITAAAADPDFSAEVNAAVLAILGTPDGASIAADILTMIDSTVPAIQQLRDQLIVAFGLISPGSTTTDLIIGDIATDDAYNGYLVKAVDFSAGISYLRWITDYVGSTFTATLDTALPFTPDETEDTYVIYPFRLDAPVIAALPASVWASGTRVLTAGTNIVLAKGTGVTGFTDLSAAAVNAEVDTAISDAALATAAGQATAQTVLDKLDDTIETTSDGNIFTADALQNAPSGGGGGTDWDADERTAIRTILGIPASGTTPDDPSAGILDTIRDNAVVIKAKTDNLPASPAATGDIPTAVQNADALLGRNVSGGSSSGRTVKQAFHFIRNKWVVAAGTLTVYDTDDSTPSWTGAVTGTPGADPVTGMDAT